jgi:signal transduction histidine kinase
MTKAEDKDVKANADHELLVLGQKTVEARAVLAALQKELSDTNSRLAESRQLEQLVEANQQLVLAILLAQADAEKQQHILEEQRSSLQVREANEQLVIAALGAQHLQDLAEHALERQRQVLTLVAHELRNPLTPISMIAGRLVRVPKEELPRMQALIEGQVQHMSRLVEDLLDVSRANTGKFRLDCRLVDMSPIIRHAVEICSPVMAAQHLDFRVEQPECALIVNGDPVRLAQILGNLLGNAAKYTPSNGLVELSVSSDADSLEIRVRDNGIGISARALPFIFEPFVQDAHAVGFNGVGLGIGLTVVRELVEAHGGTVTGTSEGDGKGSEFVMTLPLFNF